MRRTPPPILASLLASVLALAARPAAARVLEVGPGSAYAVPSAAAAAARDGDTVAIAPGEYFDCAIWHANGVTISALAGGAVVLTDRACEGKASFVIQADGVTVRGLTFTRIRVPDGNGAGIRAEGRDLTVADSRFVNDQDGILAAGGGFLHVTGCTFTRNGSSDGPAHAVLADGLDELRIANSVFADARGGDHISASARRSELDGNRLNDAGIDPARPLVSIAGGTVALSGNTVELSDTPGRPGAVLVTGDVTALEVRGNTLIEPAGTVPLVRDWSGLAATMAGNHVPPGIEAVSTAGSAYHRLRAKLAELRDAARGLAGIARHDAAILARRLKLIPG